MGAGRPALKNAARLAETGLAAEEHAVRLGAGAFFVLIVFLSSLSLEIVDPTGPQNLLSAKRAMTWAFLLRSRRSRACDA